MRFQYIPFGMSKIYFLKTENIEHQRGGKTIGAFTHCCWESKMIQSHWKTKNYKNQKEENILSSTS